MIGVLAFFLALVALVLVHEYGHYKAARLMGVTVEEFGFGFPPRIFRWQAWGTIFSVNWLPLGGFVRIKGEDSDDVSPDGFAVQPLIRRALIVAAGIGMNLVVAAVLLTVGFTIGVPQDISTAVPERAIVSDVTHRIVGVVSDSPADGELIPGEAIVSLDQRSFTTLEELQQYVRERKGEFVTLELVRDGERRTAILRPAELTLSGGAEPVIGFGVQLATMGTVRYPWYLAPVEGIRQTAVTFGLIATTLASAAGDLLRGVPATLDVTGPIGIAVLTNEVVDLGYRFFLPFVAILSINLAFVNLLPFPALDGGRLLFMAIEAVRGRRVSPAVESTLHRVGFSLLLLLVLIVTYFDVVRLGGIPNLLP